MAEQDPPEYPYDDWADIYDQVYAYLDHDLGFYVEQAKASGGPVLELGCGTGRVSLAIAEAGIDVTGVDISPRMVDVATKKAADAGLTSNATFSAGDMLDVEASDDFALVIFPFRSFQSMLTTEDQREALGNAASHLRPGGALVLDVFAPDFEQLGDRRDEAIPFHVRDVDQPDGGMIVIWGQNMWNPVEQVNAARLTIEQVDAGGTMTRRLYRDFELRYTFRWEMQLLLEVCGFTVEAVYGDFDGGEIDENADDHVWIARKK
jgi:SAM-dependent methyltransferase